MRNRGCRAFWGEGGLMKGLSVGCGNWRARRRRRLGHWRICLVVDAFRDLKRALWRLKVCYLEVRGGGVIERDHIHTSKRRSQSGRSFGKAESQALEMGLMQARLTKSRLRAPKFGDDMKS